MVLVEISMPAYETYMRYAEIKPWCEKVIGPLASTRDCVDLERPWAWEHLSNRLEFYFARKEDATMFLLKWA
jgi:hypothetical protein